MRGYVEHRAVRIDAVDQRGRRRGGGDACLGAGVGVRAAGGVRVQSLGGVAEEAAASDAAVPHDPLLVRAVHALVR